MPQQLSEEQQKAYVAALGLKCPGCGSTSLRTDGSPEQDGAVAWQNIDCNDCGAYWTDNYQLVSITNFTPKEEQEP